MFGPGRRVRRLIGKQAHVEWGERSIGDSGRVAVVAHWSRSTRMTRAVCTLVEELQSSDYHVVVCSGSEASGALEWDHTVATDRLTVLRKPNLGYDFGSWSIALDMIPQIARSERVLLVNDSMIGPFTSLDPVLAKFDTTRADVWALTDTSQFGHHLQSYFLGFHNGVLADRPLQAFWADIRHHTDKMRIILDYEVGFGHLLRAEGYSTDAAFPNEFVVSSGQNPVILGWKRLLELGFPFVKRELLHSPHVAPAGATVPELLKEMFGVDVADWTNDQPVGAI